MSPEFDDWMASVSKHKGALDDASIAIVVPVEMYDEVQTFIEEPAKVAAVADEWLRGGKK